MRIYDARIGKFLSVDPLQKKYPNLTPYAFAENKPIAGVDLDGREFVLTIYDPAIADSYKNSIMLYQDIYSARKIAFDAIHGKMSDEKYQRLLNATNADELTSKYRVLPKLIPTDGQQATLEYDKNAPAGLTVDMNRQQDNGGYYMAWQETMHFSKSNVKYHEDDGYLLDVRAFNSPEFNNFYGNYDFIADYQTNYAAAGAGGGSETTDGHLKGYGNVSYTSILFGASLPSAGVERGILTGKFSVKDYSPQTLEGYGASYGWGAGAANTSKWFSFANYQDMLKFNTAAATISGDQNGWGMNFSLGNFLKSKSPLTKFFGLSGNVYYSNSTLVPIKFQEPDATKK